MVRNHQRLGVVLGGGGARGAYEVGVLSGVQEILGEHGIPFALDVLVGSSIGALNATWLAAHAHEKGTGTEALVQEWLSLRLEDSVRLHTRSLQRANQGAMKPSFSLLDPRALEQLTRQRIPWTQLHYNLASGAVQTLVITALDIATGQTTTFAQLSPDATYRASHDPRRHTRLVRMQAEHVLASSAFPLLFPAREIEGHLYCDGGLRLNTPIAPALRAGSEKLLVIALAPRKNHRQLPAAATLHERERERMRAFPSPLFTGLSTLTGHRPDGGCLSRASPVSLSDLLCAQASESTQSHLGGGLHVVHSLRRSVRRGAHRTGSHRRTHERGRNTQVLRRLTGVPWVVTLPMIINADRGAVLSGDTKE